MSWYIKCAIDNIEDSLNMLKDSGDKENVLDIIKNLEELSVFLPEITKLEGFKNFNKSLNNYLSPTSFLSRKNLKKDIVKNGGIIIGYAKKLYGEIEDRYTKLEEGKEKPSKDYESIKLASKPDLFEVSEAITKVKVSMREPWKVLRNELYSLREILENLKVPEWILTQNQKLCDVLEKRYHIKEYIKDEKDLNLIEEHLTYLETWKKLAIKNMEIAASKLASILDDTKHD